MCVLDCGDHFYNEIVGFTCEPCHVNCFDCSGSTDIECTVCTGNRYLLK